MFVVMSVRERPLPSGIGPFAQGNVIKFCVALNAISSVVKSCVFSDPGLYQFGEGFCGARAPLTWAHCCEGNPVIAPFDKLYNPYGDFSLSLEKNF